MADDKTAELLAKLLDEQGETNRLMGVLLQNLQELPRRIAKAQADEAARHHADAADLHRKLFPR